MFARQRSWQPRLSPEEPERVMLPQLRIASGSVFKRPNDRPHHTVSFITPYILGRDVCSSIASDGASTYCTQHYAKRIVNTIHVVAFLNPFLVPTRTLKIGKESKFWPGAQRMPKLPPSSTHSS